MHCRDSGEGDRLTSRKAINKWEETKTCSAERAVWRVRAAVAAMAALWGATSIDEGVGIIGRVAHGDGDGWGTLCAVG